MEESLFRAFYESNPCMCFAVDSGNIVLSANALGAHNLGYRVDELVGRSVLDVFHDEDRPMVRQQLAVCVAHPGKCASWELRKVKKDGGGIWVRETARAVQGANGELVVIIVCEDISARKLADQQLCALNEELERRVADRTHELRTRNEEMQDDLLMAAEIQKSFLPQKYPAFPQDANPAESALQFCHRYLPSGPVGGDFFDVFALSDTVAGVFLCDVMGHNVRSALVTAMIRGLVEDLRSVATDPGHFLTKINRRLLAALKQTGWPTFASAFYMIVDAGNGCAKYASAGHPSPMLLQRGTNTAGPLCGNSKSQGPALALFEEAAYTTSQCSLEPGDSMVFFTDGLYEVANPQGEEFGLERLAEALRRRISLPTADLLDAVVAEAMEFSGGRGFLDDVCLVGMRFNPPPGAGRTARTT